MSPKARETTDRIRNAAADRIDKVVAQRFPRAGTSGAFVLRSPEGR